MARTVTPVGFAAGKDTLEALAMLQDKSIEPGRYRELMFAIGQGMGQAFANAVSAQASKIYLVMTVEDADFLGKGIASALESIGADVRIACIWNHRQKAFDSPWGDIAPILQEYRDPPQDKVEHLVVIKSIISGACVVKTNLKHILEDIVPENIHVMAPVMFVGAEGRLAKEFDEETASKFNYWTLAYDDQKSGEEVVPGIGGEVYSRLGFDGQDGKNAYFPCLVEERMEALHIS